MADETFIGGRSLSSVTGNQGPNKDEINVKGGELKIDSTAMTADAADLNILDGADTAGLVAADLAELAGAAANGLVAADLTKLGGVTASAAELNRTTSIVSHVLTIASPGTFGSNVGTGSTTQGFRLGQATSAAFDQVTTEDNSGASFADETTDAASSGAGDVTLPDPFDTSDAIYFGHSDPFGNLRIIIGTAGVGDAVASESVWEYYNGSTWATLSTIDDTTAGFTTGASTYDIPFYPPEDWAATTVDGGSSLYFIRFRATADDIWNTTQPVLSRAFVYAVDDFVGLPCPVTGTISQVDMWAETASASNNDSLFTLWNITQGTWDKITWTKNVGHDQDATVSLAVTAGDELAIAQYDEDGSTEFADGAFYLTIDL